MRAIPRMPHVIAGLLLTALSLSTSAAEKFKVCADPLNPPYSSKNQDGFENKIAELLAKELGQTVEYTWLPQRIGFIRNTLNAFVNDHDVDSDNYKCDVVMGVPADSDLTLNTVPYYHSSYVLLIAKGRGWDDINSAEQLTKLPLAKQEALKIAMFDRGPGTTWLQQNGLLDQGIPYQSMSGDSENNVAMQIEKDLKAKKIDMVILWGPMAGYVVSQSAKDAYKTIIMPSSPGLKFDFSIAMGVRSKDKDRQAQLNKLIAAKATAIAQIIAGYNVPLLPIPKQVPHKDD
ncbi:MAG: quinoprotein dehydrogenase-associated putative ABC transporter substrate-binding protein [Methylococcales bacterium]